MRIKTYIVILIIAFVCLAAGPSLIDLATQVKNTLATTHGGTGKNSTATFPISGKISITVGQGIVSLDTNTINSGACDYQTVGAVGIVTTDVLHLSFSSDPTGVTGYIPSVNGMLTIISWPTTDNLNIKVCNNTAVTITPGNINLNWQVVR